MSERTVEQITNDITGYEEVLKTELDAKHPNVRPAFEMAMREAKENLKSARDEYRTRVFSQAVGFFVGGDQDKVNTFVDLAQKLGNVFVVNAGAMYEGLADRIEPTIGRSREFSVNQLTELVMGLREVAVEAGLKGSLQAPRIQDLKVVTTKAELVSYVHELVTAALGESMNTIYLTQSLINQALERKFSGSVLAAVVINSTPEAQPVLAQTFATSTNVTIGIEDEVDETFVLKVFESAKEANKKNRAPKRR